MTLGDIAVSHIHILELPYLAIISFLTILIVAGVTKGLISIGTPVVAVPLLNTIFDLPTTVALLSIPLVLSNIPQALKGDDVKVVFCRLLPIFAGFVVGVCIGVRLLTSLSPASLKAVIGTALIVIVALMLFAPRFAVPKESERFASPLVGLIGGIMGGLVALPGPIVFVYLIAIGITRDQFVQYSSMFLAIAAAVMAILLGEAGVLSLEDAVISTLSVLPVLLGMWAGSYLRELVSADLFRKAVLGTVMLSACNFLVSGLY